ncbi:MAG TPA: hypothetical protein VJ302_01675 [Blastocatellia bacterium]|nr:hypothetical protein [Blastocatellia bacterium]
MNDYDRRRPMGAPLELQVGFVVFDLPFATVGKMFYVDSSDLYRQPNASGMSYV